MNPLGRGRDEPQMQLPLKPLHHDVVVISATRFIRSTFLWICKSSAALQTPRELNSRVLNAFCEIKEFSAEGSDWRVGNCLHWTAFKLCLICFCELRRHGHLLTATKAVHRCSSVIFFFYCIFFFFFYFSHQYQLFHNIQLDVFCLCGIPSPTHTHTAFFWQLKEKSANTFHFNVWGERGDAEKHKNLRIKSFFLPILFHMINASDIFRNESGTRGSCRIKEELYAKCVCESVDWVNLFLCYSYCYYF